MEPQDPYTADFIGLMEQQPEVQREAIEEVYWLMCLAATCNFKKQHALRDAAGPLKGLVKRIRKYVRVGMDSPVEEYKIKNLLRNCKEAASEMRRLDESCDQEVRDSEAPHLRVKINNLLERMES